MVRDLGSMKIEAAKKDVRSAKRILKQGNKRLAVNHPPYDTTLTFRPLLPRFLYCCQAVASARYLERRRRRTRILPGLKEGAKSVDMVLVTVLSVLVALLAVDGRRESSMRKSRI